MEALVNLIQKVNCKCSTGLQNEVSFSLGFGLAAGCWLAGLGDAELEAGRVGLEEGVSSLVSLGVEVVTLRGEVCG